MQVQQSNQTCSMGNEPKSTGAEQRCCLAVSVSQGLYCLHHGYISAADHLRSLVEGDNKRTGHLYFSCHRNLQKPWLSFSDKKCMLGLHTTMLQHTCLSAVTSKASAEAGPGAGPAWDCSSPRPYRGLAVRDMCPASTSKGSALPARSFRPCHGRAPD